MQTFPSVFLYNIFREKPSGLRRRGEKPGLEGRAFQEKYGCRRNFRRQDAPSPVRMAPAVTAPVRQLTK